MDWIFNELPLWLFALLLLAALLAAREIGGWVGRRQAPPAGKEDSDYGYIVSGVMVLLALLLAFTFSLAVNRYEIRRGMVVAEANAIGAAEMRARLLVAPHGPRLVALYRQYAETRLRYGNALDKRPLQQASAALRDRIQAETLAAAQSIQSSPPTMLVIPAVNETLDLGVSRETANDARLPSSILAVLVSDALIAAGILGAALGGPTRRRRTVTGLLFVLLALATTLILDLDRPTRGTIQVSQVPMERLVRSLQASSPPTALPPSLP